MISFKDKSLAELLILSDRLSLAIAEIEFRQINNPGLEVTMHDRLSALLIEKLNINDAIEAVIEEYKK